MKIHFSLPLLLLSFVIAPTQMPTQMPAQMLAQMPAQMFAQMPAQEQTQPPQEKTSYKPYFLKPSFSDVAASPLSYNNDILAYYGYPTSRRMGILGRFSKEELDEQLTELAAQYDAENGERGVVKALYIIYGVVWPEGKIGIINKDILTEYIEFASEHDMLVFIDHQIGRYDPIASLEKLLPWLAYPNVHLALDPEWRTTRPMEETGYVTAQEVNKAQQVMQDYMDQNDISGERLLVIHQFTRGMIRNRQQVTCDFERVRLVHCADGFGAPALKRSSYAYNATATNIPIKGFKLFYNFNIPGAGYDRPLMTPREVCSLSPHPNLIIYQ